MCFNCQRDDETKIQAEAIKLIRNLIQDLQETSKIGPERKQELIATVTTAGRNLIRIQSEFKKTTKIMIDDLLKGSQIDCAIACKEEDVEKRKHYYERYRRLLDSAMIRSEVLAQSVQSILVLIVEKDPKLSVKYKIFLTTTIITPIFGAGVLAGLAAAHIVPVSLCAFSLTTGGIAAMAISGGIVILLTSWLIYKTIQTEKFDWKARMGEISEAFRDTLRKYFPYLEKFFHGGHKNKITDDELKNKLQHALQCIQVDECTWLNNDSLNDFRHEIEETLNELNENHAIFEQSCSSAA